MIDFSMKSNLARTFARFRRRLNNGNGSLVVNFSQLSPLVTEGINMLPGDHTEPINIALTFPAGATRARVTSRITAIFDAVGVTSNSGRILVNPSTTVPFSTNNATCLQQGTGATRFQSQTALSIGFDVSSAAPTTAMSVELVKTGVFTGATELTIVLVIDSEVIFFS